jgi:hypothetical protein
VALHAKMTNHGRQARKCSMSCCWASSALAGLGKSLAGGSGLNFVKHAEREISARLDEQDNDRQAHNPALRIPRFVISALR